MNGRRLALPGYRIRLTPSIFDLFSGHAQYPDPIHLRTAVAKGIEVIGTSRWQVALAGVLDLPYIPPVAALAG